MTAFLNFSDKDFELAFVKLLKAKRETNIDVSIAVSAILDDVRDRGDEAVIELTRRFDRFEIEDLKIDADIIEKAIGQCDPEMIEALKIAADRIKDFHKHQLPDDLDYVDEAGLRLGYRWNAISAAGLYVPGGTAAYPSSVLMNAIPAKIAGVERLVMVVPTPDGTINPLVLAAAGVSGVNELYRIGGAQAVGALAYGTETIAPVDKIVGPGNAYVAAAKRQVFGEVGIDMIAGPSEILVVADKNNQPNWIAADLVSQAEHDVAAQSILITDDAKFAERVSKEVEEILNTLPRADIAAKSWFNFGAVIIVDNLNDAPPLINRLAPEHLELAVEDPNAIAAKVSNAGAIFLGRYAPEALGDYIAGPNHILPTARSARFSSGLGVLDFMKRTSLISADAKSLGVVGPAAILLAKYEGLDAHARSIALRLNQQPEEK
ncbi:MAG: histidinol dehydrogenase [Magnetovibrio sp.]|nr:histidinol dehydrogenase [Magnetovibrio sp.]